MSKKRGKSGSAPTGFGVKWETELISASLDDVSIYFHESKIRIPNPHSRIESFQNYESKFKIRILTVLSDSGWHCRLLVTSIALQPLLLVSCNSCLVQVLLTSILSKLHVYSLTGQRVKY